MKILYTDLHNPAFAMGGSEQIMLNTCLGIRDTYGVEVVAAVNRGELADRLAVAGVPLYFLDWPKIKSWCTLKTLEKAMKETSPDIVHCFHRYPVFLVDTFLKHRQSKLLFTEQVIHHDKRFLFRYGDFAIGCHETVRRNLIDFYGVPSHRAVTIPNAVNERKPDPEKLKEIQRRYPRPAGKLTALFIGRLHEQKGHSYFIEAVSLLPENYKKKIQILLAGEGPLEQALKAQVKEKNLEEQIVFLGHTREIPEFLAHTDFMLLPSLWEGLPLAIPEAYSAHRAVLATDIPGNKESVLEGKTGDLAAVRNPRALADVLMKWIDNPEKIKTMGEAAYHWWKEEFSFEKMIRSNYEIYQKLLAGVK